MTRKKRWLVTIVATTLVLGAGIAVAVFNNGNFETGDFTGWSQSAFLNNGLSNGPNGPFNGDDIVRTSGGSNQSVIVTASAPETGVDPILGPDASLRYPKYGLNCARVNGPTTQHISNSIAQFTATTGADVDPADGLVHIRFAYAPVMEDPPGHDPNVKPFFYIAVRKFSGLSFVKIWETFVFSGEAGVPWKTAPTNAGVKYLDWRVVDIAPGNSVLPVGTAVELEVIGADCGLGAHFGYVYVDGFGAEVPGLAVMKTTTNTRLVPGNNLTYTFHYKNGGAVAVDNVAVTENIPACATYLSSTNPTSGGTTAYASGVVTASLGTLGAGVGGTFTVTVQASLDIQACPSIDNGDYSIAGDGVSPTLGPPVNTPIVDPCTPTGTLTINSGWDQGDGTALPVGEPDNEWRVVSDPSVIVNTTEPRPAIVIAPHPFWTSEQANSKWVSSFPTWTDDTNGHYVFEYRFCLANFVGAFLSLSLRADDQATVYLNGSSLGSTGAHSFDSPPLVVNTSVFDFGKFRTGRNVITVDVQNTNNVAMGFNLTGTVVGQIPQYHYCCSDSAGGIFGKVWSDPNESQHQDTDEPGIANWGVRLYQGSTVVATTHSDGLGNYYFLDLPPGTFKVQAFPSFFKSFTTPQSYIVTLKLGDVVSNKNFGITGLTIGKHNKTSFTELPFTPLVEPNPFNPETTISFTLKSPMHVSMKIYNVEGRLVKTLADEDMSAGDQRRTWDGRNDAGQTTASGIYFLRTATPRGVSTQKLILLK